MAPPTRLRPHLNDLLQKNLELEHVVADLRHQLTESFAKWADERKTLATGCDTLMASFAKFRARLDSSDVMDSEGGAEQNPDGGILGEETGEVDNLLNALLETEGDQASSAVDLRERCDALAAELLVKEEELESSRRRHEAAEEELQRVQRSLEAQSEQLQAALASGADAGSEPSQERSSNDVLTQTGPSQPGLDDTVEKLRLAKEDIARLKKLLQQWKKYGNDWKRDAQSARTRTAELEAQEAEVNAKVQAAEESRALLEMEKNETLRLTSALGDQTAALEQQRAAYRESMNRVHDLESEVSHLRAQLSPEQLASIDASEKPPAQEPSNPTVSQTARPDTDLNKRNDMILLKIPNRLDKSIKKPTVENNQPLDNQQSSAQAGSSTSANPAPQTNNGPMTFNTTDFELCIHTCNRRPCRNESHSFLWLRKQASLPRHALSTKKHRLCTAACPGNRLLVMPTNEAIKEPRRAKCRAPTEAEVNLATTEAIKYFPSRKARLQKMEPEGTQREGSKESEDAEEPEEASSQEEEHRTSYSSGRASRKRLWRSSDAAEERARKLRPRLFFAK